MKTNYHTHTRRCLHAQGSEEDYVASALDAGVEILGFSDHAPFPDHDFGLRMPYSELEPYFRKVEELAALHAADIRIRKSLEIEYLPRYRDYYEYLLTEQKADYLLLGEHFFTEPSGRDRNIIVEAESTATYIDYANSLAEAMGTGYFRMVAHPDLFTSSRFPWDRNCDEAADIIVNAAVRTNTILELNANGFRRGLQQYPDGERYMYPHINFWKRVAGSGITVIIGSDCHNPAQVWDGCMPKGMQYLRELGITPSDTAEGL